MSSYSVSLPSSTSRSRSGANHPTTATPTQGITVTKRSPVLNKNSFSSTATSSSSTTTTEPNPETSFEEGFSIFAFGDLSMSEAYNAPAPTTGEYPLRLKRTRPPKASKKHLQLQLQPEHGEDGGEDENGGDMENILQHLYTPDYPLSPASDFKRFVEGLQSAKVASHASTRTAGVSVSKRTQAQARSFARVKSSSSLRSDVSAKEPLLAKSSSLASRAKAKARSTLTAGHGGIVEA